MSHMSITNVNLQLFIQQLILVLDMHEKVEPEGHVGPEGDLVP
jgi:hypothetical protein